MRLYGSPRRIFLTSHTGANTQQLSGKGLTDWQVWNFKIDLFNICACSYYEYLTMLIRLHTFTESSVGLPVIFLLRIRGGGGGVPGFAPPPPPPRINTAHMTDTKFREPLTPTEGSTIQHEHGICTAF